MKTLPLTSNASLKRWLLGLMMVTLPFVAGTQVSDPGPIPVAPMKVQVGQAATLMAEGNWLMTGGGQSRSSVSLVSAVNRVPQVLTSLAIGRSFHSATVMPSGEVLIHGGLDVNNKLVPRDEFFDPATRTFSTLPPLPLTPRAGHSATLLTDGRLLIVGGVNQKGEALADFEIWNPATNTTDRFSGSLSVARYQHSATLLPDGTLLILGGKGSKGDALTTTELFNPNSQRFGVTRQTLPAAFAASTSPALTASTPANGANAVAVDIQLALRMNRPLDGKTASSATLTLVGPQGNVATKVIAAEAGMLAFITPQRPLKPGTEYRLLLNAPMDTKGYPLTGNPIHFVTDKGGAQSNQGKKPILGNIGLANLLKGADEAIAATSPSSSGTDTRGVAQIDVVRPPLVIPKPLMAAAGVTAVSGVVMTLDGEPLANVHLSAEFSKRTVRTHTDRQGRFLLAGLGAGHYEVFVDARPAGSRGTRYGTFVVGVDAKAGKTNVLPYIMWMPEMDSATEITLPSPTSKEVVLTSPKIPGMEVHIPAGAIIKDHDGKVVTKLSLTPIPVDRTPFPIPNSFAVPVYFTVQPGGAAVYNAADGSPALARVIYPNYTKRAAGMVVDFWHYEPDGLGWYVYGKGTVNQAATQIVPDPGVGIYEFTGAMINTGNGPPPSGPPPGGGGGGGGGPGGGGGGGGGGTAAPLYTARKSAAIMIVAAEFGCNPSAVMFGAHLSESTPRTLVNRIRTSMPVAVCNAALNP